MTESIRTIRTILGAALAVDRRATIEVFLIGVVAWVGNAAQALTVAFFVQAFTTQNATLAWIAVVANALAFGANNYLFSLASAIGITLHEKTTHALDQRLQQMVGGMSGIEHLERPDYSRSALDPPRAGLLVRQCGSDPATAAGPAERRGDGDPALCDRPGPCARAVRGVAGVLPERPG